MASSGSAASGACHGPPFTDTVVPRRRPSADDPGRRARWRTQACWWRSKSCSETAPFMGKATASSGPGCALPASAPVFLVAEAAPVIGDAVEHEGRRAPAGLDPARGFDLLEIGRAEVELPERVAVARLEPHRRRRPGKPVVVKSPERQVTVDGRALEQ